ncbi:MAG: hypothetical protein HC904_09495 [Blastochloris sp.]|nr:hypothetical protein [Blastochloris sp.]
MLGDVQLDAAGQIDGSAGLVSGDVLETNSVGLTNLRTVVTALMASVTGTGDLTVLESNSLLVNQARTANGKIDIRSGGAMQALDVVSLTSSIANSITLETSDGSLAVGEVDAGDLGSIFLDSASSLTDLTGKLRAAELDATAAFTLDLDTEVERLRAESRSSGNILVRELDAIILDQVRTADGAIEIEAGGTITALDVQSLSDSDLNDLTLRTNVGDIALGTVTAGSLGDLSINAAGAITDLAGKVVGDVLNANAGSGMFLDTTVNEIRAINTGTGDLFITETDDLNLVLASTVNGLVDVELGGDLTLEAITAGNAGNVTLEALGFILQNTGLISGSLLKADAGASITLLTSVDSVDLSSSGTGAIRVMEQDAIELTDVDTADGLIEIEAGGTIRALDVQSLTDADANDITIRATDGDLVYDIINAGNLGDLFLTADQGSILPTGSLLTADVLTARAAGILDLITRVNSVDAVSSVAGWIEVDEFDGVILTLISAAQGGITVQAGGVLTALDLRSLSGSDDHDIRLTTTAGNIEAGAIDAGNLGDVILRAAAAIVDLAGKIKADLLDAESTGDMTLDTSIAQLQARVTGLGGITVTESDDLLVIVVETQDGDLTLNTGGNLSLEEVTAGNNSDVTLDATGFIRQTTGQTIGALLTAKADGSILLLTAVDFLNLLTRLAGDITVTEEDEIGLTSVLSFDGAINIKAGAAITATLLRSLLDAEDNDIFLEAETGGILLGLIDAGRLFGDIRLITPEAIEILALTSGAHLIGDRAELEAVTGVGALGSFSTGVQLLETELNILSVLLSGRGDLRLSELDDLILEKIELADGMVEILAAASLTVLDLHIQSGLAQTMGLNMVMAPGARAQALLVLQTLQSNINISKIIVDGDGISALDAGGSIEFWPGGWTGRHIQSEEVHLHALEGIGGLGVMNIAASTLTAWSENGDLQLDNFWSEPVNVGELWSSGSIKFKQWGGGELFLDHLDAGEEAYLWVDGEQTLTARLIHAEGNLHLKAEEMEFVGGALTILSEETVILEPDRPGTLVEFFAVEPNDKPDVLEISPRDVAALGWPSRPYQILGTIILPNEFPGLIPPALQPNLTLTFDVSSLNLRVGFAGFGGPRVMELDLSTLQDSRPGKNYLKKLKKSLDRIGQGQSSKLILAQETEAVQESAQVEKVEPKTGLWNMILAWFQSLLKAVVNWILGWVK